MRLLTFLILAKLYSSVGLAWGPVHILHYKIYATKPHFGYAGPKVGKTFHTNIYVDYCKRPKDCYPHLNFHLSTYQLGDKKCKYVWESENNLEFDSCFSPPVDTVRSPRVRGAFIASIAGVLITCSLIWWRRLKNERGLSVV